MYRRLTHVLIALTLVQFSCVEDPPLEVSGEANVRTTFIPVDSVNKLRVWQDLNQRLSDQVNDEIDYYDSLENAGEGEYTEEIEALNSELDSLREARSELSTTISRLSTGTIQLDYLTAEGTENQITYSSSQEVYGLPLNAETANATFIIGYGSYGGEAAFAYQTETIYEERMVRLRGRSLQLLYHTFDSVKVKCIADTCTTDEILVTFYF